MMYRIEKYGKIHGETFNLEQAKTFAKNLGKEAVVFAEGGIVVYPL